MTILKRSLIPLLAAFAVLLTLPAFTVATAEAASHAHRRGAATLATTTAPVQGTVTFDRSGPLCTSSAPCTVPAQGVTIRFAPAAGSSISAVTDSQGRYAATLATGTSYSVTISDSLGALKMVSGANPLAVPSASRFTFGVVSDYIVQSRIA